MDNERKKRFDNRSFVDTDNKYRYIVQRELLDNKCNGLPSLPTGTINLMLTEVEVLEEVFMTVYTNNKQGNALLSDFLIMQQLTLTNLNVLEKSVVNLIPVTLPPTSQMLFFHLDNKSLHSCKLELFPKAHQTLIFTYEFYIDPMDFILPTQFAVSTFFKIRTV